MFLTIKNIPKVSWSSNKPYNFKPKFSTLFFLCFGLTLFGLGEGLLIVSLAGMPLLHIYFSSNGNSISDTLSKTSLRSV